MRKTFFNLMTIILLTPCAGQNKVPPSVPHPQNGDGTTSFIGLFPEIGANGLHIYSPRETLAADKFQGKQIPAPFYKYLKFGDNIGSALKDTSSHFFGCFKFKMTGTKTGLIIRRPSQYSETAIDLYTWDDSKKKIVDVTNLTDAFGDEGWYFVQDAWLKDLNNDKKIDIITRRKDFYQNLYNTSRIDRIDSVSVFLNDGATFKKTGLRLDISKFRLKYWKDR